MRVSERRSNQGDEMSCSKQFFQIDMPLRLVRSPTSLEGYLVDDGPTTPITSISGTKMIWRRGKDETRVGEMSMPPAQIFHNVRWKREQRVLEKFSLRKAIRFHLQHPTV